MKSKACKSASKPQKTKLVSLDRSLERNNRNGPTDLGIPIITRSAW